MFLQSLQNLYKNSKFPVALLITINIIIGLFVFQNYGLSLDEPLYYGYGEAIGYAYSPSNWFSGEFDLIRAYGPSPGDHANRGPAYLIFARIPAILMEKTGLDMASAWHLVNFLFFQVGLNFFYVLCLRWMRPWAAFGATIFMSTQPILWEHAFVNPKDPPFLVLFIVTLELGFRMADRLANPQSGETRVQTLKAILPSAIILGLTTNIRVLGPLAAVLAGIYFLTLRKPARIWWYIPYGVIAYVTMVITWPYLWEAPIGNFIKVVRFMADNPTTLNVFFFGDIYNADALPRRYLPTMMLITLTEPVWIMASLGFILAAIKSVRQRIQWRTLLPVLGWLGIPMLYVLLRQPPMYDGFRHFLFITPPLFVFAGIALDSTFEKLSQPWLKTLLILLILSPGLLANIQLHPYQYTYYNQFVGGLERASKRYETDYWLTCYKESVEELDRVTDGHVNLFVRREYQIAAYYASSDVKALDHRKKFVEPGDFLLYHSRAFPNLQLNAETNEHFLRIERDGAIFCEIREQ